MSQFNFNNISDFKFVVFDGNKQLAGFNKSGDLLVYLSVLNKANITISILYSKFYLIFDYEEFHQTFVVKRNNKDNIDSEDGVNDSSSD